jgi:LuxR family maltose regulon positive regulatory protein
MSALAVQSEPKHSGAAAAVFDLTGLTVPDVRAGSVARTPLVNRLRAEDSPVVTVVSPAGCGKTNVIAQWAEKEARPFAWLSIGEDDDPLALCRAIALALGRVVAIDPSVLDALAARRCSLRSAISALASAVTSLDQPFVLALDDVHRLRARECGEVIRGLAEQIPHGASLVLAGRALPWIPSARLKVAGRLTEIGPAQLALSRREIEVLLHSLGVELDDEEIAELATRTEGWTAGVYLAALAIREARDAPGSGATDGAHRSLADYFEGEYLSSLSPNDLGFHLHTSVLDTMCGSLCDAVLRAEGSGRRLAAIERSGLFLVPLDRQGEWFRYHPQFRAVLRGELGRSEPKLVRVLNRRAAAWCQANGEPEAAIAYAHAAGDVELVARLVATRALPAWSAGGCAVVETWFDWFDETSGLENYPAIAVLGAWVHALRGRAAAAARWLDVASCSTVDDPPSDGSKSFESWIAVVRAAMCREGPLQMQADAEYALRELGPASRWRPTALLLHGAAKILLGDTDGAEVSMADAAEVAESVGATPSLIAALAEQSLLLAGRGDDERASAEALQARRLVDEHQLDDYIRSAIAFAASARAALRAGDFELARADLEKARSLRPHLSHALPWYSVHASVELARVELCLLDVPGARAWMAHAGEIARRRPDLGVLRAELGDLEAEIDRVAEAQEKKASTLTAAELRLVPFLATHLSFREIGSHLYVSRNTVKTQAISIYRKLGVSSRGEAIERAAELGLIEAAPVIGIRSSVRDDALSRAAR